LSVRSFAAACACARELQQWLVELRTLYGVLLERQSLRSNFLHCIVEAFLLIHLRIDWLHNQSLILSRTYLSTVAATGAVQGANNNAKLVFFAALADHLLQLHVSRSLFSFFLGNNN